MKNALQIGMQESSAVAEVVDSPYSIELLELGVLPGSEIKMIGKAPSGNPIIFEIDGNLVAIRKELCSAIIVNS